MFKWNPFSKPPSHTYIHNDMAEQGFHTTICYPRPRFASPNPKVLWPGEIEANIPVDYRVTSPLYTQPDNRANYVLISADMREVPI